MKWLILSAVVPTVLASTAIVMIPAPPEPKAETRFDETWSETVRVIGLGKADRLTMESKPVVTERIVAVPAALNVPPVAMPVEADKPAVRRRRHVAVDVCTRHGLRKVTYGKRWRCRK